ncbi:MAG: tetratricopeptide repeat protein [Vulcanimicrobiota bacterium]
MPDTLTRARDLLEAQDFETALNLLHQVSPVTSEVKSSVARALSGLGRWQEAHALFSEVVGEDPGCSEGFAGRGLLYFFTGQFEKARNDYDQAIELEPENGRYHGLRGVLSGELGDAVNALSDLETAYQLGDQDPSYILARAQLLLATNQLPEAEEALQLAEQHDADSAALSSLEGALSMLKGNPKEALASYRFAVEQSPQVIDNWMNMLALTARLDRPRLLEEVTRALESHPDNEEFLQLAVGAMVEAGQPKEAFNLLNEAIERNPESPLLHFQMGMGLAGSGHFEKAVEHLSKALELRPRFPRALDARGNCLERLSKEQEAQADFEESARIRTEDAERA